MSWLRKLFPKQVRGEIASVIDEMRNHLPDLDEGETRVQAVAATVWCVRELTKVREREGSNATMFQRRIDQMTERLYALEELRRECGES